MECAGSKFVAYSASWVLRSTLPDLNTLDREALKALLRTTHEQLLSRESEIEHLKLLLAKLQRMQFGRKSEKLERQIEQLELRLEDLEAKSRGAPARSERRVYSCSVFYPDCYRETGAASAAGTSAANDADASHRKHRFVPTAAESCASWAKMSRRCWSTCRLASR